MQPYRSDGKTVERYEVQDARTFHLNIGFGVALLVGAPAAYLLLLVLASLRLPYILPLTVGGVFLLLRARRVVLEVSRGEREVRVSIGRIGPTKFARIPFDELEGVRVVPDSYSLHQESLRGRSTPPNYSVVLVRRGGEPVTLLVGSEVDLEQERGKIGSFLLEHGALAQQRSRVELPAAVPFEDPDDVVSEGSRRRGGDDRT